MKLASQQDTARFRRIVRKQRPVLAQPLRRQQRLTYRVLIQICKPANTNTTAAVQRVMLIIGKITLNVSAVITVNMAWPEITSIHLAGAK